MPKLYPVPGWKKLQTAEAQDEKTFIQNQGVFSHFWPRQISRTNSITCGISTLFFKPIFSQTEQSQNGFQGHGWALEQAQEENNHRELLEHHSGSAQLA